MRWIDGEYLLNGEIGFLVETCDASRKWATTHSLRDRPCHTNVSHEPRLRGWCGSTNNISYDALGLAKVVRVAKNGRVQIVEVKGEEGAAWLENEAGYPELIPEKWAAK